MKLHELSPVPGSTHAVKRVGRGAGSGNGKTAGKGHKGQNARSGGGVRPGFEGGQTPLAMRLPKLPGFRNPRRIEYTAVNVERLERKFEDGAVVDTEAIVKAGLVKKLEGGIKVLGNGEITKNLTVKAAAFSKSAKEKIEKAGGKTEVI